MFYCCFRRIAKPVREEIEEVAVAVGAAIGGAVADGEGGFVRLIRGVAIEGGSRKVLDVYGRAATVAVRVVINPVLSDRIVCPTAVKDSSEESGGVLKLVLEPIIF